MKERYRKSVTTRNCSYLRDCAEVHRLTRLGFTAQEIAKKLDISLNTVWYRLRRYRDLTQNNRIATPAERADVVRSEVLEEG